MVYKLDSSANKSLAQIAQDYHVKGWAPIAYPTRTKRPNVSQWEQITHQIISENPDYLAELPDGNIGLVLGTNSNGLVDVDCDCPEAVAIAPLFLPQTDLTHGRGTVTRHYWFTVPDAAKTIRFQIPGQDGSLVELRANGGQTMVPPSIHPNGESVVWTATGEPGRTTWAELVKCVSRLASACALARVWNSGKRHDMAMSLSGGLMRAGWSMDEVELFLTGILIAAEDEEEQDRMNCVHTTFQSNGNTTGFPRLAELAGQSVVSKVLDWLGCRQDERIDYTRVREVMGKPATLPEKLTNEPIFGWVKMADVAAMNFKFEWWIQDFFAMGACNLWVGESKIGKTTFLLQLAEHASREATLWDRQVFKRPTYYLDYEMGHKRIASYFRKLNISPTAGINYASSRELPELPGNTVPQALTVEWLDLTFRGAVPSVIIVDNLRAAFYSRSDLPDEWENKAGAVRGLIDPFQKWANRHGHCLIIVHHTNKQGGYSGSGDLKGGVDNLFTLSGDMRTNSYKLDGGGRDAVFYGQEFRREIVDGKPGMRFALTQNRRDQMASDFRGYLVKTIAFLQQKRSRVELIEHLGMNQNQFRNTFPVIKFLKDRNAVVCSTGGDGGYVVSDVLRDKSPMVVDLFLDQQLPTYKPQK